MNTDNISPTIENINKLIKSNKRTFRYALSDVILFLLYADTDPISGKIKQMKEVFLSLVLVFIQQDVQPVHFEKKNFGPYSEAVEYTIDQLIILNLISASGKKNSGEFKIQITPKGRNAIKDKYNELPHDIQQKLKSNREAWDKHVPSGLIKLVYTHFPQYLEHSVLKKRHKTLDWTDDNQRLES